MAAHYVATAVVFATNFLFGHCRLIMSTIDPNTTPALQPPPGVLPNFNDPYNTDSTINGTLGICIAISSIFVLLRLYTKLYIIRKYGWEDCQ